MSGSGGHATGMGGTVHAPGIVSPRRGAAGPALPGGIAVGRLAAGHGRRRTVAVVRPAVLAGVVPARVRLGLRLGASRPGRTPRRRAGWSHPLAGGACGRSAGERRGRHALPAGGGQRCAGRASSRASAPELARRAAADGRRTLAPGGDPETPPRPGERGGFRLRGLVVGAAGRCRGHGEGGPTPAAGQRPGCLARCLAPTPAGGRRTGARRRPGGAGAGGWLGIECGRVAHVPGHRHRASDGHLRFAYLVAGGDALWPGGGLASPGLLAAAPALAALCLRPGFAWCLELRVDGGFRGPGAACLPDGQPGAGLAPAFPSPGLADPAAGNAGAGLAGRAAGQPAGGVLAVVPGGCPAALAVRRAPWALALVGGLGGGRSGGWRWGWRCRCWRWACR